jgi:thymidylate synthase
MIHPTNGAYADRAYQGILSRLLNYGKAVTTRNSRVLRGVAETVEFHTTPLVSVRKTSWKNALREWEWFMSGSANIRDLHPDVRHWWEPWVKGGVVWNNYSAMFRRSGRDDWYDQIEYLVDGVRRHPYSRRNLITTWETERMADPITPITNCHGTVIQAFVDPPEAAHRPGALTLVTYQRSADVVCGLPHNWLQYFAFLLWLAHRTGHVAKALVWIGGDVHLYEQHFDIAHEVLAAATETPGPRLVYTPTSEDFKADDFALDREYRPKVLTRAEMVV